MKGFIRFIERYKILHGAYWAWALIGLYHERMQFGGNSVVPALQASTIQIAGEMLSVYLTLYLIIPKTFRKTRYGLFVLLTLLSCLIGAAVATGFAILYIFIVTGDPMRHVLMWMLSNTVDCFIATAIFVAVSTVYSLYLRDRLSKKMEREKLETELSFLRAQMNPHFLFNAINNIYVLIDLDPKQAGETLLRFSGLLRYHLYECKEELVELSRELHFLNDYINMQSLRKGARIRVDVALPGDPQTMRIAPFLLLPFVENAFKFVSTGKSQQNWISNSGYYRWWHFLLYGNQQHGRACFAARGYGRHRPPECAAAAGVIISRQT